jgi:hypothetical protein
VIPRLPDRVDTLVPADAPTVDLDDVKNERVLLWAPGGTQTFIERDGTTYLSSPDTASVISEQDQPLSPCASASQRGCVSTIAGRTVVRLAGNGPLKTPTGTLAYSGDTGPTERLWEVLAGHRDLRALLMEISFPNDHHRLAKVSGHHTPESLEVELGKLDRLSGPGESAARQLPVLLYHIKPVFELQVERELARIAHRNMEICRLGEQFIL